MPKLNGWQRLFVVFSLAWGIPLIALTLDAYDADPLGALTFWFIASLLIYALGSGIAWTRRGFKE
jgi:hypothetical protein